MKFLIDTHIAIWAISDDSKLSKMAKEILIDENNEIYYSTASQFHIGYGHTMCWCRQCAGTFFARRVTWL